MGERGERYRVESTIHDGTFHGPVVQAGKVWMLFGSGRGPLVVLATVMALIAAVTTYLVLGRDDGAEPTLTARYDSARTETAAMMLPRPFGPTAIPASVSGCPATWAWLHTQGGLDVGTSHLVVEATGGRGHTVAIQSVKATVVGTPQDPPAGTIAYCPPQGLGTALELGIDLDSADRAALIGTTTGETSYAPFFTDKYLYLEDRKPEEVKLGVLAASKSYEYVLTVEGSVDGKHRTWTLKDGDRPFRVTGIRTDLPSGLRGEATVWVTEYGVHVAPPVRCNPCSNEGAPLPGTSVPGAPKGPAPPPGSPWAATDGRPSASAPPLTVIPQDPESVALAWIVTVNSFDVRRGDTGLGAVLPRLRPYMTPKAAQEAQAEAAGGSEPDNPDWPPEVTARRGWSAVASASAALVVADRHLAGQQPGQTATVRVSVEVTYRADDGWSHRGPGLFVGQLILQRQSDGTYLVDAFRRGG
ncbi:hypothetical protein [Kitasatospora sp. NPDC097691]|uniref:hypothetical protein n=1 Tax=Kitasatospora sp. NPDC097691 TaxID=3157231 RepID=UPI003327042A